MKDIYKSNTTENPEFIYHSNGVICLNDKIDFLQRIMIFMNENGETLLSFSYKDLLCERVGLIKNEYEYVNIFEFQMKENPIICSFAKMIKYQEEYYFEFSNGYIATYKINPDYIDSFIEIAEKNK